MGKIVIISAVSFFGWLVLDALDVPTKFLYFLVAGEVPGTSVVLSPTQMLAIVTTFAGLIVFELFARRVQMIRRVRRDFLRLISRNARLPRRRFSRI